MQTFRSLEEVTQAQLPPKTRRAVTRAMRSLLDAYGADYDPDDCGYVVFVDKNTTDSQAVELFGLTWPEARLEGVTYDKETECFLTCILCNNQFGYTIIVNRDSVPQGFQEVLTAEIPGGEPL